MITITDAAQAHFAKLLANQEPNTQIRVLSLTQEHLTLSVAFLTVHPMQ